MTNVKAALTTLGWRVDTNARLAQGIKDFQRAYNLSGAPLAADGNAGPSTVKALATSLARNRAGQPDISANFSAREFACNCDERSGGPYQNCRRIWTPRSTIALAEKYRAKLVGPFSPVRAGRCTKENANVGGVPRSYHLTGRGLDVPVYAITVAQAQSIGARGVGYYVDSKTGRKYVRHIDDRDTAVIPWSYGVLRTTPLKPNLAALSQPNPPVVKTPAPPIVNPTPTSPQEDDMSAEDTALLKKIDANLKYLTDVESGRYSVATGRYGHHTAMLSGIADKVGAPIDVEALADELGERVTAKLGGNVDAAVVKQALKEALTEGTGA